MKGEEYKVKIGKYRGWELFREILFCVSLNNFYICIMKQYKICTKCHAEKHISLYHLLKASKDGHNARCKECVIKISMDYYEEAKKNPEWMESQRVRAREKHIRLGYKGKYKLTGEKKREARSKYNKKYPEKRKARKSTEKMKPQTQGNELHHWSYNEPHFKDVIELTPIAHAKAHRYMVYDPERKMYRRADNNILLDTREAHIEFINSLSTLP